MHFIYITGLGGIEFSSINYSPKRVFML